MNPALNRKEWTEQEERNLSIIMEDFLSRKGPDDTIPPPTPADADAHKGWASACEAREIRPS